MTTTRTIEPVDNRSMQTERLIEHTTTSRDVDFQNYVAMRLDAVGSENLHCVAVRDAGLPIRSDTDTRSPEEVVPQVLYQTRVLIRGSAYGNLHWSDSIGSMLAHIKFVRRPDFEASSSEANQPWFLIETPTPPVVQEFARGVEGVRPTAEAVVMATHIVQAALGHTVGPHITVDDEDGDLDFHLRLTDGLLVMANLFPDGTIDASVYDDSQGIPVKTVKRMRRASTSAEELIHLFRAGIHDSTGR